MRASAGAGSAAWRARCAGHEFGALQARLLVARREGDEVAHVLRSEVRAQFAFLALQRRGHGVHRREVAVPDVAALDGDERRRGQHRRKGECAMAPRRLERTVQEGARAREFAYAQHRGGEVGQDVARR